MNTDIKEQEDCVPTTDEDYAALWDRLFEDLDKARQSGRVSHEELKNRLKIDHSR